MEYTQLEISKNIEELVNKMDSLKLNRTEITKNINSIKKQIEEWKKLDLSQLKMF